jgi:hypothetical protein
LHMLSKLMIDKQVNKQVDGNIPQTTRRAM